MCELTKGFSVVAKFGVKRALYWPCRKGMQLSRILRLSRALPRFNFLRGGGETISREYVPEELDAWLVELAFRRIDGEAGLVTSAERFVWLRVRSGFYHKPRCRH